MGSHSMSIAPCHVHSAKNLGRDADRPVVAEYGQSARGTFRGRPACVGCGMGRLESVQLVPVNT